ncbi:MAG: hypothetical protein KAQ62_18260 [Cyclobacteriaceae bacterium]|nr:hypothetical protein [Cyclobacteriaceae bacterium]
MRFLLNQKFSLLVVLCICLSCVSCGGDDNPVSPTSNNLIFEKTYPGTHSSTGNDVIMTSDGSYLITGSNQSTSANGSRDVYLLKVDNKGAVLWEKTFGGVGIDYGAALLELPDGGYLIGGSSSSFGDGNDDYYLIKTDSLGITVWEKTYDAGSRDHCASICLTSDGGYLLIGTTSANIYIIKVDSGGGIVWDRTFLDMSGASIIETADNNFMIAGTKYTIVNNEFERDAMIMKINSNGIPVWTKTFGIEQSRAKSIFPTSTGGYIAAGYTQVSSSNIRDMYLINIDSNGDTIWIRNYGGDSIDSSDSVTQTSDGGFILTGSTDSFGAGNFDLYLVKVDQGGSFQWQKTFGGTNSDYGRAVVLSSEDGFVITGTKDNELYLIKTDANGNVN